MAGLEFLHANHIPRCTATVDKAFSGYHTLQYCGGGSLALSRNGSAPVLLERGWFWSTPQGERWSYGPAQRRATGGYWNHRYVAFQGPLADHWESEGLLLSAPQRANNVASVEVAFNQLLVFLPRTDHWGHRLAVNLLEGILLQLAQARPVPTSPAWLSELLTAAAHGRPIDTAKLAAKWGISLGHLRRMFREQTGVPLATYFRRARVLRAKAFLAEGDRPLKVIADELGFTDAAHFSRCFRDETGLSPGRWRHRRRET